MCKAKLKKGLFALLVLFFVVQSSLVYTDVRNEPMSPVAVQGRVLWHRHACQTCHQLYGQGGFLGPDLTNAASRVDSVRLASLLRVGSGQMPPIGLNDSETAAISAFLVAMDRPEIGRGQLRLGDAEVPAGLQEGFEQAVADRFSEITQDGRADLQIGLEASSTGFELVRTRSCSACHRPFRVSVAGVPDLSIVVNHRSRDSLTQVLTSGRPERGMPPPSPGFTPDEIDAVIAYFGFLNEHRTGLNERTVAFTGQRQIDWRRLPWWEFQ